MRHIFKVLTLIVVFVLQGGLCPHIEMLGIAPNLVLATVIIMALSSDFIEAGIYGGCAGMLMDIFWGRVFGFNTLIFLYVALAVRFFLEMTYKNTPTITAGITFVAVFVYELIYYFFSYMIWGEGVFLYALLRVMIPAAAYTAAIQFVIYKPVIWASRVKLDERGRRII